MIKGARKQMIVMRTGNSRYFDEAYFVLRKDWKECPENRSDMLCEANRILADSSHHAAKKEKARRLPWLFFAVGGLCGGVLATVLYILLI